MIYKYIDLNQDCKKLHTALNGDLWLSSRNVFNDPYDCSFPVKTTFSEEEIYQLKCAMNHLSNDPAPARAEFINDTPEGRNLIGKECYKGLQDQVDKWGICSFSNKWNSILMWSHYAAFHQGLCLGYDVSPELSTEDTGLHQVRYSSHYPEIHISEFITDFERAFKNYLLTKYTDWRYEHEYRLLDHLHSNEAIPSPWNLTEITIGCDVKDPIQSELLTIIGNQITNLYLAEKSDDGTFGLKRSIILKRGIKV